MGITIDDWKKTRDLLVDDISAAAHYDDVYWQINAIIHSNPEINKPNHFLDWLHQVYVDSIIVRLRKLTDKDRRTISLWNLLDDLRNVHPPLASEVDIALKQQELTKAMECVLPYANTIVAHHAKEPVKTLPTYVEVRKSLVSGFKVFNWCASLTSDYWATAAPLLDEWVSIFRIPWLKDKSVPKYVHFNELLREVIKEDTLKK